MVRPVPAQRIPSVDPGRVNIDQLHAALLDDIAEFDAAFFGVSRRMAAWMDPHQRMLLELTWHALESAAIDPERLCGLPVAVFAAAPMSDYRERMVQASMVDSAAFPGTLITFTANRISYQYDWTGPSYAIDSACSSGLSVLAPAVQGLRTGEFPLAAVMAANLTCNGFYTSSAIQAGAMSPTGRSIPFSTQRDGYIRGEGGACLLLKRLDDAEADGDPVLAVIRGVGVAHNGRAGGLTGTDAETQARLIMRTARAAHLPVSAIGYVEAHGTGTGGDLAEVEGVVQALAEEASAERTAVAGPRGRLWIGSIKSNIGHLETAAGLLGVVKAVLILRHGLIPPIAGLDHVDPAIALGEAPVAVADRPIPWPAGSALRRIGVNSFGIGGSMAHALIEEAPATRPTTPTPGTLPPIPLSAADQAGLSALAARYAAMLVAGDAPGTASIAWTLAAGRAALGTRRVLLAENGDQLLAALAAVASGMPHARVATPDDQLPLENVPDQAAGDAADWLAGASVDWREHWPRPWPTTRYPYLPGYPFQRRPHWFAARLPAQRGPVTQSPVSHDSVPNHR